MNDHHAADPHDRDLNSPVDIALAEAMDRAGDELGEVPAEVVHAHLDAITALAAAHAHRAPVVAGGWRVRLRRVAGLTAAKVALGAGVAAAATGGLAATGNLPDSVQQVVSDGAGRVGIQLPQPSEPATAEDQDVHDPQHQDQLDPAPPLAPSPPAEGPAQDTVDAPDQPVSDAPEDVPPPDDVPGSPPADEVPGSRPAGPPAGDPATTPRPQPEPAPTPQPERPTPAPETSPSPRSPAEMAPAVPDSEKAPDVEGDAGTRDTGQVGDPDGGDGSPTPAAG